MVKSERLEMSYIQDTGLARLVIRKASKPDSGEYTCVATGEVVEPRTGRRLSKTITSSSTVLIEATPTYKADIIFIKPVEVNLKREQEEQILEIYFLCPYTIMAGSVVMASFNPSSDINRLEAQILADIQPIQVTWMLGDRELVQSDRVEMTFLEDTGVARLVIRKASQPDSGQYTCVATGDVVEPTTGRRLSKTIASSSTVIVEGIF
ncbi:unnamed protein product [Protopolystoma xenopodis]|uniref:Ig-like domain-containing protein n=1 Tax=Protopolystoma xenopodis TaxID=117903 RepID=A0A448WIS1_9PLAT|nr:unnamed protein product [Protopolystoma xenopodis]